jgi:hypothetical protein
MGHYYCPLVIRVEIVDVVAGYDLDQTVRVVVKIVASLLSASFYLEY